MKPCTFGEAMSAYHDAYHAHREAEQSKDDARIEFENATSALSQAEADIQAFVGEQMGQIRNAVKNGRRSYEAIS